MLKNHMRLVNKRKFRHCLKLWSLESRGHIRIDRRWGGVWSPRCCGEQIFMIWCQIRFDLMFPYPGCKQNHTRIENGRISSCITLLFRKKKSLELNHNKTYMKCLNLLGDGYVRRAGEGKSGGGMVFFRILKYIVKYVSRMGSNFTT